MADNDVPAVSNVSGPILPAERYLVVPRIGIERAQPRIYSEICDGALRPPDARQAASVEGAQAIFVPFWRVDVRRHDEAQRQKEQHLGYLGAPTSGQGSDDGQGAWMVCAHSAFPYEMRHPSSPLPGDFKPLSLHLAYAQPGDPDPAWGWSVLDADVAEETARALATASSRKYALEPGVLFGEQDVVVRAVHFVRYPIWFARYRYRAEYAPTRDGMFYVGISALDEAPITAVHPSKLAAGTAKLKKLFGFGG